MSKLNDFIKVAVCAVITGIVCKGIYNYGYLKGMKDSLKDADCDLDFLDEDDLEDISDELEDSEDMDLEDEDDVVKLGEDDEGSFKASLKNSHRKPFAKDIIKSLGKYPQSWRGKLNK